MLGNSAAGMNEVVLTIHEYVITLQDTLLGVFKKITKLVTHLFMDGVLCGFLSVRNFIKDALQ
jgi:hypothetical protein